MTATPRGPLFAPLPKPPSAFSLTVRRLLGRAQEGAIRVPPFQRPLRWQVDDVVRLLDSILKGYPIGSLLFWKQRLPADDHLLIGSARVRAPETLDGWWIVDGQQRTTALTAALLDLDQAGDPRWDARFDPTVDQFLAGAPAPEHEGQHVPVRTLGDLRRLGRWLRTSSLSEEQQARVEEVQQRLLDYEIPCYVVDTDDVNALRGIFARLNSTGVRMRADEVFQALLGPGSQGAQGGRAWLDLRALQQAADLDGFGEPPRAEVLKAVLAMSGQDPSKRLEDLGEEAVLGFVDPADAADAIRRTVAFLQAPFDAPGVSRSSGGHAAREAPPGAGIPAYALIPYPVAFVILARWFYLFPEPENLVRVQLARWLWRGVASRVHQRAAVSALRYQVREIREGDALGSLKRLLDAVGDSRPREWTLGPFHASHAASRVEVLALLSQSPRDRSGPVSWRALLTSGERIAREVFRVDLVNPDLRPLARSAANRILLDARRSNLERVLRKWRWPEDREALASHLIDERGFDDLRSGRAEAFLTRRAARVRPLVAQFLEGRAGVGVPEILPVETYYEQGSSPGEPS